MIRKFKKDERAIELPINIVVMLVVGMVALAALLSIIPKSKEYLTVDVIDIKVNDGAVQEGSIATLRGDGDFIIKVNLKVYDKNNNPVEKASITLNGGGGFGTDQTNSNGEAIILLGDSNSTKVTFRPNQQTVQLKLAAKANGFYDYEDINAIQLFKKS